MQSPSRNVVLAVIGLTFVIHAVEEYLAFPEFLSANRLPRWVPRAALLRNPHDMRIALVLVSVAVLGVIAWAILRPNKAVFILSLLIECILLVNAGWHILASAVRGGYAPGVITAVLINVPFGIYVLRRAIKEGWIRPRAARRMIGIAFIFHIGLMGTLMAG